MHEYIAAGHQAHTGRAGDAAQLLQTQGVVQTLQKLNCKP